MKSVLLVTPAWQRYELTALMLARRAATDWGDVRVDTVVIADDDNLDIARAHGFATVERDNDWLGRRYNDGHEYAYTHGYDWSFHVNSDQAFDPRLLQAIVETPRTHVAATRWMAAVNADGRRAAVYRNPIRAMQAFPRELLAHNARPCRERLVRGCDKSTHDGVRRATGAEDHIIEVGPLETVQFESAVQLTSWKRHQRLALADGSWEIAVPWDALRSVHGPEFVNDMRRFYDAKEEA